MAEKKVKPEDVIQGVNEFLKNNPVVAREAPPQQTGSAIPVPGLPVQAPPDSGIPVRQRKDELAEARAFIRQGGQKAGEVTSSVQGINYKAGKNKTGEELAAGAGVTAGKVEAESEKGPRQVKNPFNLKNAGILLGGLALAKLLGNATKEDLSEFAQGYVGMLNQQKQSAEQAAMEEWKTRISGLATAAGAKTSASGASTGAFSAQEQAKYSASAIGVQVAGLGLQGARTLLDTGAGMVNLENANFLFRTKSREWLQQNIEQQLKLLPAITSEGIQAWVNGYNTTVAALNEHDISTGLIGPDGKGGLPYITVDQAESMARLLSIKDEANVAVTEKQKADLFSGVANNIVTLTSTLRNNLVNPNEKVRSMAYSGLVNVMAPVIAALPFKTEEQRSRFISGVMNIVQGTISSQTPTEATLGVQQAQVDVQKLQVMTSLKIAEIQASTQEYASIVGGMYNMLSSGQSVNAVAKAQVDQLIGLIDEYHKLLAADSEMKKKLDQFKQELQNSPASAMTAAMNMGMMITNPKEADATKNAIAAENLGKAEELRRQIANMTKALSNIGITLPYNPVDEEKQSNGGG